MLMELHDLLGCMQHAVHACRFWLCYMCALLCMFRTSNTSHLQSSQADKGCYLDRQFCSPYVLVCTSTQDMSHLAA